LSALAKQLLSMDNIDKKYKLQWQFIALEYMIKVWKYAININGQTPTYYKANPNTVG
jgi:hypothetical protein